MSIFFICTNASVWTFFRGHRHASLLVFLSSSLWLDLSLESIFYQNTLHLNLHVYLIYAHTHANTNKDFHSLFCLSHHLRSLSLSLFLSLSIALSLYLSRSQLSLSFTVTLLTHTFRLSYLQNSSHMDCDVQYAELDTAALASSPSPRCSAHSGGDLVEYATIQPSSH